MYNEIPVKTVSPVAGEKVQVSFGQQCRGFLIKNFSSGDIYMSLDENATTTEGSIRIPANCAQTIMSFSGGTYGNWLDGTCYIYADAASSNSVEVQAIWEII